LNWWDQKLLLLGWNSHLVTIWLTHLLDQQIFNIVQFILHQTVLVPLRNLLGVLSGLESLLIHVVYGPVLEN
jgi:hypothetical protein